MAHVIAIKFRKIGKTTKLKGAKKMLLGIPLKDRIIGLIAWTIIVIIVLRYQKLKKNKTKKSKN